MSNGLTFVPLQAARRAGAVATASFVALLLGGCLNWSSDVGRYRTILDGPQPATRPIFDAGGELSLIRALDLANTDNEAIASRGEDYVQALAEKMRQAGTFLPTLTLAPSYTLTGGTGNGGGFVTQNGAAGAVSTADHQFSVPLNASISGSLANASNLQAAGRTVEQRAQLLLDERETILLQVVQSYYSALKAERQGRVYENSLRLKTEKVRDQEARLKLGNVRPLDLAQTQADLSGTRVSLTQARTDAANARSALARLIGVPAVTGPLSDSFDPPANVQALGEWQLRAATGRQDLVAAARAVESAKLGLDAAIRQYFPSVTVNFSYFLYNDPTSFQTWSSAFSANIPIFSALSIEAGIRKAWSVYRQAGITESQTARQVVDDVNQSFRNLQGSRQKIADLRVQVEAAQRAYDLSERSYQLGSISNLDRLTQQDSLLTAELNLVSEQFNEKSYYLGLLRAAGGMYSGLHQLDAPAP